MPSKAKLNRAFSEVYKKEPKVVSKTRKKRGAKAAQRQKIAIAISKAKRY